MTLEEMRTAMNEASSVMFQAEQLAKRSINFSAGKLRRLNVDSFTLAALKKELSKYNIHTGKWRD